MKKQLEKSDIVQMLLNYHQVSDNERVNAADHLAGIIIDQFYRIKIETLKEAITLINRRNNE